MARCQRRRLGAAEQSHARKVKAVEARGAEWDGRRTMPKGAHCNHCGADDAVVPVSDYENDRFIYVCVDCGWWALTLFGWISARMTRSQQPCRESRPDFCSSGEAADRAIIKVSLLRTGRILVARVG